MPKAQPLRQLGGTRTSSSRALMPDLIHLASDLKNRS